jgi:hypothetical protein
MEKFSSTHFLPLDGGGLRRGGSAYASLKGALITLPSVPSHRGRGYYYVKLFKTLVLAQAKGIFSPESPSVRGCVSDKKDTKVLFRI